MSKVKKQVVAEKILAYVKRSAEKKCRHTKFKGYVRTKGSG